VEGRVPKGGEVVVDSGILIHAERGTSTFSDLRVLLVEHGVVAVVPVPILAEVWRAGSCQARLARALKAMDLAGCTETIAKRAGALLAATEGSNAMDAIVVATAETLGCDVITADVSEIGLLASHATGVGVITP